MTFTPAKRIETAVGKLVAAGVPQHGRVDAEGQLRWEAARWARQRLKHTQIGIFATGKVNASILDLQMTAHNPWHALRIYRATNGIGKALARAKRELFRDPERRRRR